MADIDLGRIKSVYIIGIKGSGVVAIAQILKQRGILVSGSDVAERFFTDEILAKEGIEYNRDFDVDNVPENVDLVIYSTAYNEENNVEFREAKKLGIDMISYPEAVAYFFNTKKGIAVTGTHGKTTTSAILAYVLDKCGENIDAIIGGKVKEWGGNALVRENSEYFVLEADEYQNKLKLYEPHAAILTSVSMDHPDFYKSFDEYKKAFSDFVSRIPQEGFLIVCGDHENARAVSESANCDLLQYGFAENNGLLISNWEAVPNNNNVLQKFDISVGDEKLGQFSLRLPGRHNAQNAASVVGVCHKLGIDMEKVNKALGEFLGTTRRFEYIGKRNGATLIDDYGHHPEEIVATLGSIKSVYPGKKVWVVFHPHSFSRTESLLQDFGKSFDDADNVIVLDIYSSARESSGNVSSQDLVELINNHTPKKAMYIKEIPDVVDFLKDKIGEGDLVLSIGAGNVFEVVEALKEHND